VDLHELNNFIEGGVGVAYVLAAVFFVRFWRTTRDALFLWFAAAFALMALVRITLSAWDVIDEHRPYVYSMRLVAFGMIIAAIIAKNRARRSG
jgi:hypothetical protein